MSLYTNNFIVLEKPTERVVIDLCLGVTVREQRGTIISNRVKNPTTYPTTISLFQKRPISISRKSVIAMLSKKSNNTQIHPTTFRKIQQQNPTTFLVLVIKD